MPITTEPSWPPTLLVIEDDDDLILFGVEQPIVVTLPAP